MDVAAISLAGLRAGALLGIVHEVGPNSWLAMLSQTSGRQGTSPQSAVVRFSAGSHEMGSEAAGQSAPREAEVQSLARDENEAVELVNDALPKDHVRRTLRCECGDPSCQARVAPTHAEYEAVRAYGSHFLISPNHENPENTWVLCENARFAVIDVVAGDERYQVLGRNPRHAWVEARDRSAQ
jgi:hypothetical protein